MTPGLPGTQGLIAFWPHFNGTSEGSHDLVQGRDCKRDNVDPTLCTTGAEITADGIWMPYVEWNSNGHSMCDWNSVTDLGSGNPFTILAWTYPPSTGSQRMVLFCSGTDPRFYMAVNSNGRLFVGLGNATDNALTPYVANKWQLFSYSYDGNILQTTVDGLAPNNSSFSGSKTFGNSYARLGDGTGSIGHWNGKMGPVAIYNRYMTATEIVQIRHGFWESLTQARVIRGAMASISSSSSFLLLPGWNRRIYGPVVPETYYVIEDAGDTLIDDAADNLVHDGAGI